MEKSKQVFVVAKKAKRKNRRKQTVYKPLPTSMKVRIRGRTYDSGTGATPPIWNRFGLVEFLGRGGSYIDTLFGLYKYARVHKCKITCRLVNMGSEPVILAVAPLPHSWTAGSPTVSELVDVPLAKRKTASAYTGMDKVTISHSLTAAQALGNELVSSKYVMDATQAASSTPLFPDEPAWIVGISSFNALTTVSYRLEVELEFDVDFFSLDSS